jgi:hypothetical protein
LLKSYNRHKLFGNIKPAGCLLVNPKIVQWAIVGAGPAGIAAVGKLLDSKINPAEILWLDPHFKVGDLGALWSNVSSNTTVKLFTHFLNAADSFAYQQASIDFQLNHLPPQETCLLNDIAEPLQWISDQFLKKVTTEKTMIHKMNLSENVWSLEGDRGTFYAKNVILATGAEPENLHYPNIQTIPFDVAIDKIRLTHHLKTDETYAVFGSSHSAIIIINHLVDLRVKKIINFYRSPCRYAIDMGDWILFDNTGLKGHTARWSRQHIDGTLPKNLVRYISNESNIERFLPECDQAIYAVGFKRRHTITIGGYEQNHYNPHVGIIGPGLFGFGIAYPEIKPDHFGCVESNVGLWKFMVYLNKVLPVWFKYHT